MKIMIVDDDLLFRSRLMNLIESRSKTEFYVCASASNGQEALRLVAEKAPDIILTDVRMPVMDGVELMRCLKRDSVSAPVIVLSNYDDYSYVKETLKNGALDYLLKHEVNEAVLREQLERAADKVREQRNMSEEKRREVTMESYVRKNLITLRNEFFCKLVRREFLNIEAIRKHMEILELPIGEKRLLTCLMALDRYTAKRGSQPLEQISLVDFSAMNILDEILQDGMNGCAANLGGGQFLIVCSFEKVFSQSQISYSMNALLSRISVCMKNYLNDIACFCLDNKLRNVQDIGDGYKYAKKLMDQRFFYDGSCILQEPSVSGSSMLTGLTIEKEKELCAALEHDGDCQKIVNEICEQMKNGRDNLLNVKMIINDLFGVLNREAKKYQIPLNRIYAGDKSIEEIIRQFTNVSEVRGYFAEAFQRLKALMPADENAGEHSWYVKETLRRIREGYDRDLSLTLAAEELGISPGYLSRVFKDEMGTGFADYLTDYRIGQAMRMMSEHRYSLKEIARLCGFPQYTYFVNVFKKKNGDAPKSYMSRL